MLRSRDRSPRPELSDQRRLRIVLLALAVTLVLTNTTAYLVGRSFAAASDRRTDHRIAALEADLAERRAARADMDAQQRVRDAERQAADAQLRRDACIAFDRLQPRDREVLDLRRRYGCTGNPKPAVAPAPTAAPSGGSQPAGQHPNGNSGDGAPPDRPRPAPQQPPAGPPGPQGPQGPTGRPAPSGDGLTVCLPIVGCLL